MINALRFRGSAAGDWRTVRFAGGTGRFVRYQGLTGDPAFLRLAAGALRYVINGDAAAGVAEASLQLADDAGNLWIVDRKPSGVRMLRNGEPMPGDGERALLAAVQDTDAETKLRIASYRVDHRNGRLTRSDIGAEAVAPASLLELIGRQIRELCLECAKDLALPELADARLLIKLTRELEPMHAQHRELARQYKALTPLTKDEAAVDVGVIQRLEVELALLEDIAAAAEPLLIPGVTLKVLKEELQTVETRAIRAREAVGLPASGGLPTPDLREPMEVLCRLEMQARLIRAAQSVRSYCDQRIEPAHRQYLDATEASVVTDRQIAGELESCLTSLTLRLGRQEMSEPHAQRSWFDRLKLRTQDTTGGDPRQRASQNAGWHSDGPAVDDATTESVANAELETTRMAVEYALARLAELENSLRQARERKTTAIAQLDGVHDDLTKGYNRLREEWQTLARARGLPEDLSLEGLADIVSGYGDLAKLDYDRAKLETRVQAYQTALVTVERLVLEWRQKTASQKSSALSTAPLLIAEVRDIVRYRLPKQKRIAQLKERAAERLAEDTLRALLRTRRDELLKQWQGAFESRNLSGSPAIHHEALALVFKRVAVIRGLALLQGAAGDETGPGLFEATGAGAGAGAFASVFLWEATGLENRLKLALLEALETAPGSQLRILLVGDPSLAQMLAGLGIGIGSEASGRPAPPPARRPEPLTVPRASAPAAGSTLPGSHRPTAINGAPVLNERALQALQVLTGRRG